MLASRGVSLRVSVRIVRAGVIAFSTLHLPKNGCSRRGRRGEVQSDFRKGGPSRGYYPALQSGNFYIARANALEDNIDLFKTEKGKRSKIEEASIKVTEAKWHTLSFAEYLRNC
jgi:hypothetical protein